MEWLTSTMSQLKSSRDRIILLRECLWPLSSIIQAACSDDETDYEDDESRNEAGRGTRPCLVRALSWRSRTLESVCTRLDTYKLAVDKSIPGVSPGQKGRRPRARVRGDNRPMSRIEAPVGLPVDCYSEEWISSISAVKKSQLAFHPQPVLQNFISLLDSWI